MPKWCLNIKEGQLERQEQGQEPDFTWLHTAVVCPQDIPMLSSLSHWFTETLW
jgi:hypothetical protein